MHAVMEDLLGQPMEPVRGEVRWSPFYESFVRMLGGGPSAAGTFAIQFVTRNERKARFDRERSA